MYILICQSLRPSKQGYEGYDVIKPDVRRIVLHRHYAILVTEPPTGNMVLNVTYKKEGYYAVLKGVTADQAAAQAKPFFEAIKAGLQTFEVR